MVKGNILAKKKLVECDATDSMNEDTLAAVVSILHQLCKESPRTNEEITRQKQNTTQTNNRR